MKIKKFQRGVAEIGVMVLSFLIICLGLSIMGVRNYYLLSNYKSETFKVIPEDVDLCSNINFYPLIWQLEHGKAGEEPQEISDMNILLGELQKKSGLDVKEDLLSWMEPEVSFGLFKVENFYRYMKAIRKLDKCKENISYIDFGLETYYEKHKSYPKELKELVPDYIEEIPSCPCEGRYEYKTEKENQVFLLECCENAHIEAGLSGRFPSYRGEKGENTEIACEKELPSGAIPEWILVAGVKDTAKAEAFLSKMTEKGQVKISSIDYKDNKINSVEKYMSFCFSGKFLIISNSRNYTFGKI